jgi:biotin carboxylase
MELPTGATGPAGPFDDGSADHDAFPAASSAPRQLVAVAYGPRSVAALQIAEAAADICDLLWIVDARSPEIEEMGPLLRRFGAVVDIGGLSADDAAARVQAFEPAGIVTYFDDDMVAVAEMAAALGLPFVSPESARLLVDKLSQRDALGAAGVEVPGYWSIGEGPSDRVVAALPADINWPVVLKPRSETGSHNTFLAQDLDEVRSLLDGLGDDRSEMILEEYLSDDPAWADSPYADYVSVESIVSYGDISHIAITGRFPQAETFRETGFFIPAALDVGDQQAVLELARQAIDALGITFGCLHTEIKFTRNGPRILEVNGRIGFGIPAMLEQAAGFAMLATSLRVALGERLAIDGPVACKRVGYRLFLQPPAITATVEAIEGLDPLAAREGIESVTVRRGPGWEVDWREGTRSFVLAVVGVARDQDEVREVWRVLHDDVQVSYRAPALAGGLVS